MNTTHPSRSVPGLTPALLAGALGLAAFGAAGLWAANYTITFGNVTSGAGVINLGSPHGGTDYRNVTSKFNQPRAVNGTNPHNGVDLSSSYGTRVYMLWNGWITSARPSSYELDMYLDINNDGVKNDNAHVRYDHLASIQVSSGYVTKGTWVASSGSEGGAYPAHLHFGLRKDTGTDGVADVWIRNEPYYRSVTAWDAGRRLDFTSYSVWSSANVASIYCYAADEVSQSESVSQGDVVIFHRQAGTSAWTATTATKNGNQFTANLAGKYPAGSSIHWMGRCNRTSKKSVANPYWAFMPPKFYQPDYDPNATAYTYDYFISTVN